MAFNSGYTNQIETIIANAKQLPNSESKNRMLSHLKDARAHAIVMEREEFYKSQPVTFSNDFVVETPDAECICPSYGVISSACKARVHKLS